MDSFEWLFISFAFVLGAIVGSFLNVCIYRMPLDMSVNEPRRSFCPHCKWQIPWFHNLPLFSWLLLRARCANCGAHIPFRYFFVELLTACAFALVVWHYPLAWALPLWIFVSLLITATFIDFDHFIIPDEITWGGTVAGLVCSVAVPSLMHADSRLMALVWSLTGAAVGFASLYVVVEAGKIFFGKKVIQLPEETAFTWIRKGQDADLIVGEETTRWSDIFSRESDRLVLKARSFSIDESPAERLPQEELVFYYNRVLLPAGERMLETIDRVAGRVSSITIPREAMGFGDVKFIACIGAFLGWKAVFFTIFSASIVGALAGGAAMLIGGREASAKIPFGPYLALGAVLWMALGPQLVAWYWELLTPAGL